MSDYDSSPSTSSSPSRRFSLFDMKSATDNFADELVIGRGGFGKVYKGSITDGESMTVAVKRLNSRSRQGAREFRTEIEMLSRFRYRYLVSLIGYCEESDEMILVYEYMPRGTLADHLHKLGKNYSAPLPWLRRLRICIDTARGLDYLHTGTSIQPGRAIHRDVKSSNILLDDNWDAKISDFGLSRLGPEDQAYSHVSTEVKGTFGYLDPEYYLTRRLTRKSDVYAFGVVMLEALCGRPAVDLSADEEQWGLAGWGQYCIREGTVDEIIDPSLGEEIKKDCLMEFVQIADECLHNLPRKRPTMAEIVVRLEFAMAMQEGKDSSIVVKPAKSALALQEREDSSDVVKPAKMTRKVQLYFSGTTSESKANTKSDNKSVQPNEGGDIVQEVPPSGQSVTQKLISDSKKNVKSSKKSVLANGDEDTFQEVAPGGQNVTPKLKAVTLGEWRSVTDTEKTVKSGNKGALPNKDGYVVQEIPPSGQNVTQKVKVFTFAELRIAMGNSLLEPGRAFWVDKKTYAPSKAGIGMAITFELTYLERHEDLLGVQKGQWLEAFLAKFSHPNLVKHFGYCLEDKELFLMYKIMQNGSLDSNLSTKAAQPLPWVTRLKIAIEAAQALAFLHATENQAMYFSFTASKILLDKDFSAKLIGFGIDLVCHNEIRDMTGYNHPSVLLSDLWVPEYNGNVDSLTVKSDVYGFGVVLVQILTGRRAHDRSQPSPESNLVSWVRPFLGNVTKHKMIMDAHLEGEYPSRGASQVALLARSCLVYDPELRPSMEEVLKVLKKVRSWRC